MSEEVSSAKSPEKVEKIKGHCPNCGPNKNAAVVGHHQIRDDDDESGVWALRG